MNKKITTLKIIICFIIIFVLVVLGGYVERVPLYSRAIVLGIAIDRDKDSIVVYAETLVNGNSTSPGSPSAYDVVKGEGSDLTAALNDVAKRSGLLPSYAHCELLIIGKDFLTDGFDDTAVILFKQLLIQDNTRIVAVNGSAGDIINSMVPIIDTPSEYIINDLKTSAEEGNTCVITLKDYVQRVLDGVGGKILTAAERTSAIPPTSSEDGKQKGEFSFFDRENSAAFDFDNGLHFYGKEITTARSLTEAEKNQFLTLTLTDRRLSAKVLHRTRIISFKDGKKIKSKFIYYCTVIESKGYSDDSNGEKQMITDLTGYIENTLINAYEQTKKDNVDIFSLKWWLYKRYGDEAKDVDFESIEWETDISVKLR